MPNSQLPTESRHALVHYSRIALERGLSNATSGNLSKRTHAGMLITPSGMPPENMSPDHVVEMTLEGTASSIWKPSSEWALHAAIYRARPEVNAIVHAHPTYCTAFSALRQPIPAFHYLVGGLGGIEIPCSDYRTFGTSELAAAVTQAVGTQYHGCLMANHGMIAFGHDIARAFARAELMETLAQQYLLARSIREDIVLLTAEEMADVATTSQRLGYGQSHRT